MRMIILNLFELARVEQLLRAAAAPHEREDDGRRADESSRARHASLRSRRFLIGIALAGVLSGCARHPAVTYEYEPWETTTSSDAPAPAAAPAAAPSTTTTLAPAAPVPSRPWVRGQPGWK